MYRGNREGFQSPSYSDRFLFRAKSAKHCSHLSPWHFSLYCGQSYTPFEKLLGNPNHIFPLGIVRGQRMLWNQIKTSTQVELSWSESSQILRQGSNCKELIWEWSRMCWEEREGWDKEAEEASARRVEEWAPAEDSWGLIPPKTSGQDVEHTLGLPWTLSSFSPFAHPFTSWTTFGRF